MSYGPTVEFENDDSCRKGTSGIGGLGFFGVLRLRLARRAAPNSLQDDGIFENFLEGGEDDGENEDAEEKGAAVGDGVDDGVFVEIAA